jgi:hypothetical protein
MNGPLTTNVGQSINTTPNNVSSKIASGIGRGTAN